MKLRFGDLFTLPICMHNVCCPSQICLAELSDGLRIPKAPFSGNRICIIVGDLT